MILASLFATALIAQQVRVFAQEGVFLPPGAGALANNTPYSCDPDKCLPPNCFCASKDPPGGLSPSAVPQFITVTFDDSIQPQLLETAYKMLNISNPNGCKAKGTWFVSMQYTDYSSVQQWYARGNEVADHTFNHVGTPSAQEILSCQRALNAYAGVPFGKVQGFRAPFLNYTMETLKTIKEHGFMYDASASSAGGRDYYPYTLDNGLANDCWKGVCDPSAKFPGVFEIPMYTVTDGTNTERLMDVYHDGHPSDVKAWTIKAFENHYNGKRQPFGIYVHPTHLTTYLGMPDASEKLNALVLVIQEMAAKNDVWFVTNQQLLSWMRNPVPASELAHQPYMKCELPDIKQEICNGLDDSGTGVDVGLINSCNFGTSFFKTCFNCPSKMPTVYDPVPEGGITKEQPGYRAPLPDNCDSKWWDPLGGKCLCTTSDCQYKDTAVPIMDVQREKSGGSESGDNDKSSSHMPQKSIANPRNIGLAHALALLLILIAYSLV